jgi:glycosyltransferase involved in cell wall biosynthesis
VTRWNGRQESARIRVGSRSANSPALHASTSTGSYVLENGHAEALGVAILEFQAVGTPLVAFDSGGVAEGIDPGRSGFVVPEKDINAMSDAVAKLLVDPNRWQSKKDRFAV